MQEKHHPATNIYHQRKLVETGNYNRINVYRFFILITRNAWLGSQAAVQDIR